MGKSTINGHYSGDIQTSWDVYHSFSSLVLRNVYIWSQFKIIVLKTGWSVANITNFVGSSIFHFRAIPFKPAGFSKVLGSNFPFQKGHDFREKKHQNHLGPRTSTAWPQAQACPGPNKWQGLKPPKNGSKGSSTGLYPLLPRFFRDCGWLIGFATLHEIHRNIIITLVISPLPILAGQL